MAKKWNVQAKNEKEARQKAIRKHLNNGGGDARGAKVEKQYKNGRYKVGVV